MATPPKKPWPPIGGERRVSVSVHASSQSGFPLALYGLSLSNLHGYWLACLSLIINPQWTIHILPWVVEGLQNSVGFLEGFSGISRCFQTSLSEPAFLMVPIVLDGGIMWESRSPSRSFRSPFFRMWASWRTFLVVPKGVSGIQRAFLRLLEGLGVISIN